MPRNNDDKLTAELFAEYAKTAVRQRYVGPRADIRGEEGFAWLSSVMGRWCFVPLRKQLSADTVVLVNRNNLQNL